MSEQELPRTFRAFTEKFPDVEAAHAECAKAVEAAGPLDKKTIELVKIGVCAGAGLESGLRSHTRRALEAGATAEEIVQAVLLSLTTVGFPRTVAAWQWARREIEKLEE